MAVFGLMARFAAALMLRFGLRRIMMISVIIVALGMAASTAIDAPWQLTALWGFVVGGGTGMTALVGLVTLNNHRGKPPGKRFRKLLIGCGLIQPELVQES